MNLIQILSLALLQGIAEVFPISSSGHLVLLQRILEIEGNQLSLFIYLHFASLIAIIFFLWPQIKKLRKKGLLYILIASIPAAVIGLLAGDLITSLFSSPKMVSLALLVTAILNLNTHQLIKNDNQKEMGKKSAFRIGLAQALAIIPGISRSGTTLNASLRNGVEKNKSLNFIFMISIIAISEALLFDLFKHGLNLELGLTNLALAFIVTFISTLLSLKFLKKLIKKENFLFFAIYCLVAAIATFFLI